jgi:6-phosphogluconolactonase
MPVRSGDGLLLVGSVGWHIRGLRSAPAVGDQVDRVHVIERDRVSGLLGKVVHQTPVAAPSFLCRNADGTHVYAVSDLAQGRTVALRLHSSGQLVMLDDQPSGGVSPCHISLVCGERFAVSANYGDGTFGVHKLNDRGELGQLALTIRHVGSSVDSRRQSGPHMHMVRPTPDDHWIVAVDLGIDELATYAVGENGHVQDSAVSSVRVPAGSGPRHVVFGRRARAYVVNELGSTFSVLSYESSTGRFAWHADYPTSIDTSAAGAGVPSAVLVSEDQRFLYIANRKRNRIAVFDIWDDIPRPVGEYDCGGRLPRDMVFAEGYLYVSNAASEEVAVLACDADTGALGPVLQRVRLPAASSLLAAIVPIEVGQ